MNDEEILKLWKDPNFAGSFRGIKTFQVLLKTDLNIDISEKKLRNVLKSEPIYLIHKKPQRNFKRRFYDVKFYGEVVQMDLAHMFEYENYKYFLLFVDVFSSKVFVRALKDKSSESVKKALMLILNDFKAPITKIESDQGSEFKKEVKNLLKEHNILLKLKYGKNKAAIAEHYIFLVKKRLFMLLRGTLSQDWPKYLYKVVSDMNNTPIEKLGFQTPNSVTSIYDSVIIRSAQKIHNIEHQTEPNLKQQAENEQNFLQQKNALKIGSFCYLDFDEKLFDKSFDVSVCPQTL